jgi:hypothetical protein
MVKLLVEIVTEGQDVRIKSYPFKAGDNPRCPKCGKPNLCWLHRYAYLKWLKSTLGQSMGNVIIP